jgi:hypothetical protein
MNTVYASCIAIDEPLWSAAGFTPLSFFSGVIA